MEKTKFIHEVRAVKSKKELVNIIKAQRISERVLRDVLKKINTGVNEIKIEKSERRAKTIEKTARDFLNKKYKNKFLHGLGHGIGTVIHEWPNFKPKSKDIIPAGCVMTVEPGLYFKGFGGVRIEDMILITRNGYKNLTKVPKDLKNAIL